MTIFEFAKEINPLAKPIVHDRWTIRSIDEVGRPIHIEAQDSWEFTYEHGLEFCPICSMQYWYKIRQTMKRVYRIESGDMLSKIPYDAAIDMQHLEEIFERGLHSCFISMEQLTSIIPRQTILEGGCVVREYLVKKYKVKGWQGLFDPDDIVCYKTIPLSKMKTLSKEFTSEGFHLLYYSDEW